MQIGGIGFPEVLILLMYPIMLGIGAFVFYWIVRKAVKAGILDAKQQEQASAPKDLGA